jgi:hypothetical protein
VPIAGGLVPGCEAVIMQLPVPLRVTVADDTPPVPFETGDTDWLPMAQGPVALKFTCNPFGAPFDSAVAVTDTGPGREAELGKEPRTIVWLFVSTAGGEGALCPCEGSIVTGSSVVEMV